MLESDSYSRDIYNIFYLNVLPRVTIAILSDVMPHVPLRVRKTAQTIVVEHYQTTQFAHVS